MIVNKGDESEIMVKNVGTVTHALSMRATNTQASLKVGNLPPGVTKKLNFKAEAPGVYIYHCAPGGHGITSHTIAGCSACL